MLYFEIIISVLVIFFGISEIYRKKIFKKEYQQDIYILYLFLMYYLKDSPSQVLQWLLFIIALIIIFIMLDKLLSKIKTKR